MPQGKGKGTFIGFGGLGAARGVTVVRCVGALGVIALITAICASAAPRAALVAVALYLVAIVAVSSRWGLPAALAAAGAATVCLHEFFLAPSATLSAFRASDRDALLAFLLAAVAVSLLARSRTVPRPDAGPRDEMERLYALSRAILLIDPARPVAKQMAYKIAQIFDVPALALYDRESGEILYAGPEELRGVEEKLREAALRCSLVKDVPAGVTITAVRLGGSPIGSIAWRGIEFSDSALHALSNLVAIGLERARGQAAAARAEAARQGEELKSTLLDAIAHEFKTPLTSIKAAASAMLSSAAPQNPEARELVTIIDEEADHLERLVSEALHMARVEGGKIQLAQGACSVRTLIQTTLDALESRLEGRNVEVDVPPGLPPVAADSNLMTVALRQLVDNAIKYSPPSAPLLLRAKRNDGRMIVSVADRGLGIDEAHLGKIFDRFYRVPFPESQAAGMGMGLAIAREIVTAHEGEIWAESTPGEGSEFFISMPILSEERRA